MSALRRVLRLMALATTVGLIAGFAAIGWYFQAGAALLRITSTAAASQQWTPDQPLFILLLGSDQRPGGGGAGCNCSDAIHLVAIPAGGGQATIINIPRDTRVAIPGRGTSKINAAHTFGGPQLAADTVSQFVGVPISYTMVTSFDGLVGMIDEIGGIAVDVPTPVNDSFTDVVLDAGPVPMDGDLALRYARSRHIAGGDFARSANQAVLMISMLTQLRETGTSPADTIRYLAVLLARHTELNGMSTGELYRLGRLALGVDPANVRSIGLPAGGATIGGTSYVIAAPQAADLFADLADDAILQFH